jgi:hypothetical protein
VEQSPVWPLAGSRPAKAVGDDLNQLHQLCTNYLPDGKKLRHAHFLDCRIEMGANGCNIGVHDRYEFRSNNTRNPEPHCRCR